MDRDVQSRRQKAGAASHASSRPRQQAPQRPRQAVPPKRGLSSRVGLQKRSAAQTPPSMAGNPRSNTRQTAARGAAQNQTPTRQFAPQRQAPPWQTGNPGQPANRRYRSRTTNPQSPGYRQGAARPPRRVTQVEKMRIRRRRKIVGILCLLAVLAVGVVLSINLLFKVTGFRVENTDRTTPANTGIYTEQQIIDLLGVQTGDNLFGFSTKAKSQELQTQLPYLDVVEVDIQLPGTVVIKVQPATERFAMETSTGWLVLSDGLKVLRGEASQPDGLILLDAAVQANSQLTAGSYLNLVKNGENLSAATPETAETAEEDTSSAASSTDEEEETSANEVLFEMVDRMEEQSLLGGVTMISMRDPDEISFLYQGRVSVLLGTSNNLDYKMRLAANIILDVDGKGLTSTDRGTLDVSYQRTDGEIVAYFMPADPAPAAEPETGDETGDAGDTGDTAGDGSDTGDSTDGDSDSSQSTDSDAT